MATPLRALASSAVAATLLAWPGAALAANCSGTSTGLVPLPDLGGASYQGEAGGLYPGGTNEPPTDYAAAGDRAAQAIVSRDPQGRPDANGKIVLLSLGMSNATQEFSAFVQLAQRDQSKDGHVVVVDGAQDGQDAVKWTSPDAPTWSVVEQRLRQAGASDGQVQAIWLKEEQAAPHQDFETHIRSLADQVRRIADVAATRYPNLQQLYLSPRTYAGYATSNLNPEPYAYWSGFADKLVIAESVARPDARPWVGWGPYLWTDGTKGRSDGLVWTCQDVRDSDGTHPSDQGRMKVGKLLQQFFDGSRLASWYRGTPASIASASPGPQRSTTSPVMPAEPGAPQANDDEGTRDWQLPVAILAAIGGIGAGGFIVRVLARR